MEYTIIMKRLYETEITVEANSLSEALSLAEQDENRFTEELEQCNVTTETYKAVRHNVLSPDGFAIDRVKTYGTREKAEKALDKWVKRYEQQGYYSSNNGRIPLDELKSCCKFVEI